MFELEFEQSIEGDYILCMTSCYYLLPSIHQCVVTVRSLSVLLCHRRTMFFFQKCRWYSCRKYWNYDYIFAIYNMNECTFNIRFAYIAYIDVFYPAFQW